MIDRDIHETPGPSNGGHGLPRSDHDLLRLIWERQGQQGKAIEDIKLTLAKQNEEADRRYVTQAEFAPYRTAMNLIACAGLLAVVGAILYLVVRGGPGGHADKPTEPPISTTAADHRSF